MKKFGISVYMATLVLSGCGGSDTAGFTEQRAQARFASTAQYRAAQDYTNVVQQLYVAYFGRPADSNGLANFATVLSDAGAPTDIQGLNAAYSTNSTVKWLIDAFGTSDESKALYSGDTTSFVTSIYQNVLGRAPDADGLNFWVNAIDKNGLTRGNASFSIMAGALANTTPEGLADAALIRKRIDVAKLFTSSITTPTLAAGYYGNGAAATARSMLNTVTSATDVAAFSTNVNATLSSLATNVVFINGYATKGPMNGAKVTVYAMNADGSRGDALGEGTTSADNTGMFSVPINSRPSGPIAVSVSNGSYSSQYNGSTIQATTTMDAIVDSIPAEGVSDVSVTPLSEMVVKRCEKLVTQGSTLSAALNQARTEVQALYNLSAKPESLVPSFNPSLASSGRFAMAMILVSLESFVQSTGASSSDSVYATLAADFSDGQLDGRSGMTSLTYGSLTNVTSTLIKDRMFTDIRDSVVAAVNGVAPASVDAWSQANPASARAKGISSPPPGYSCTSGYTLVSDSSGNSTCWDGTTASDGTPIIGLYTVCNGTTMAGSASCPATPSYSCPSGYQLISDQSGSPTCWDGTRTSTGEIYLGGYYICGANNARVASESQCPPSGTINMYQNSTTNALFSAGTPGILGNSTIIATYTAPQIETFTAESVPVITASDVAAIRATSSSWSLPSWASLGSLTDEQMKAINAQTTLLTRLWAKH